MWDNKSMWDGAEGKKSTGYLNHSCDRLTFIKRVCFNDFPYHSSAFRSPHAEPLKRERDVINNHFSGNKSIMQVFAFLSFL